VPSAASAAPRAALAGGGNGRQGSAMAKPKPEIVDWLEEVFAPLGAIGAARLFGGWQLKADGRAFAVVLDGTLYFVAGPGLAAELAAAGGRPFRYAKRGSMVTIGRFLSAPEADMDDEAALVGWGLRALIPDPDD
jgi:DNA transformation protein and related proteins